jgi:hypothetical protein
MRRTVLPNPPPAVVHCLKGIPPTLLTFELVIPTGAHVATVAESFERWPAMSPDRVGYGGGQRDLADRPNVLRLVMGKPTVVEAQPNDSTHVLLETTVDDMTGELAAHAITSVLERGAVDAWATPVVMKKGRPGLVITALVEAAKEREVTETLLRETTSIGVRRLAASRVERPRRTVTVTTLYGDIRVKVSEGPYGPAQIKPEYEDCASRAREHDVPLREVVRAAAAFTPIA